ncbi:MAG: LysE family translocator [Bacteroidales bacterium]
MGFELFWNGFVVGLMVSIPLGPIGVLCVQRTLNKGRKSGFISGLGAASADTIFSIIAALGVTYIIRFVREQHIYFQIIGGIIILFLGIHIFYTNPVRQLRLQRMNKNKLSYDFFSVFFLTISNPMAILLFLAMFTGIHIASESSGFLNFTSLITGVFAGASAWWFVLSSFVNFWRHRFRLKIIWWMNKVAGVLIFILGILAILSIWFIDA